ncbi:DUF305 domain-containing protein [Sphaerisporangium corydalis]|uniref:DUF305 domain-containing protein n=1 Tax=Sphaerisporangium corydalis TaxID=1441875 RepID=A0ABV9EU97_9ACTN|nr:DUF305 domain-containing protein [Sphaerisporangium corydalis]
MRRATLALVLAVSLPALPACAATSAQGTTAQGTSAQGTSASRAAAPETAAAAPAPAATGPVNAADVMFLQMMIPHNRQGMEMAALARTRAVRAEVKALAAAIESTQRDEARTMTGWLLGWGRSLTADPAAHGAHGGLHVTDPADIAALRTLTGAGFETRFLNVLLAHQHNAIDMARTEAGTGSSPEVKDLAGRIDRSRTAEVGQLLRELS